MQISTFSNSHVCSTAMPKCAELNTELFHVRVLVKKLFDTPAVVQKKRVISDLQFHATRTWLSSSTSDLRPVQYSRAGNSSQLSSLLPTVAGGYPVRIIICSTDSDQTRRCNLDNNHRQHESHMLQKRKEDIVWICYSLPHLSCIRIIITIFVLHSRVREKYVSHTWNNDFITYAIF